ncbi:hypothetical protein [Actinomadura sp. 3N508]|uniref:hypothetical protein n=1 Tax=Actinomadura sp. 3N508 TaxID=3375153 RepID=UPI0037BC749D
MAASIINRWAPPEARPTSPPEYEAVARLWREHVSAPFPARLNGADRAGFDMVMLDADPSGCVWTWLTHGGSLDERRHRTLLVNIDRLDQVLPCLDEADDPPYWRRLHQMSQLVADAMARSTE